MLNQEVKTQNQSVENKFQKENVMQISKQKTLSLSVMSEETFHTAIATFRSAVKDPNNKPRYDKSYGTKYAGLITFEHFVFYALLRGVDIRRTTHSITSERFLDVVKYLDYDRISKNDSSKRITNRIKSEFGLTTQQMMDVLEANKQNIAETLSS
tara:strand:- start:3024 stop:3488 length:465 start_codon:yes stop_codon:yes gene_type:complete